MGHVPGLACLAVEHMIFLLLIEANIYMFGVGVWG